MAPSVTNGSSNGSAPTVAERTANLVRFCSELQFKDIPADVVERTKSFYLDTIACAVAGQKHDSVKALMSFAKQMGPSDGSSEFWFTNASRTSAAFAVLVNGAASHVVEQDDLNNLGMIHSVYFTDEARLTSRRRLSSLLLPPPRRMSAAQERSLSLHALLDMKPVAELVNT
jgi:hypothetical protein